MSEPTITENMGLYLVQHNARLREIRRALRKLERQAFWDRMKRRFKRRQK
jgi:curved DNA-binding protein CbpA